MSTGFFGGSFDPIHFGHLNLALEVKEKLKLRKVLFCPAFISPFKKRNKPKASPKERLEMLELAIKDIEGFEILDFEIKKEKTSYTIETLRSINNKNLRLIINHELLSTFHLWKEYKEILKIAPLIVGINKTANQCRNKKIILKDKNFVKTNIFEISSTMIRQRLKKRLYIGHLLPKEVMDYIYKRKIYF